MSSSATHTEQRQNVNQSSIVVVTNHFPYGLYESFLESELPVLQKHFRKVIIVCRDVTSTGERPIHGAIVHRVDPKSSTRENLITIWLCARHSVRIWRYIQDELKWLKEHNRKMTSFIFDDMVHTVVKALQTAHHLRRVLRTEALTGNVALYSYWLTSSALALTFISSRRLHVTSLARAHGGDVYEYRNEHHYLPFRRTLIHQLNRVFAISEDAAAHLRRQCLEQDMQKVQVSRLGTRMSGTSPGKTSKRFTLVSCAFLVPVKRVHLLVDALQQIDQFEIHWIHIGSGPLEELVTKQAKAKLSGKDNITYQFAGSLTNDQLMQLYRDTYVDVFVNTSSAEGIPVTMMEAQSFGIPVVAPHVGGIPEIVSLETGRLFDPDASPLAIAQLICEVLALPANDAKSMRQRALQNWKSRYNADENFSTFVADIEKL